MIDHDEAHALIAPFEGTVPFMYLDTHGYVTVGVGNLLATPQTAIALNWQFRGRTDAEPNEVEIADEWARVHSAVPGLMTAAYKHLTTMELVDYEIRRLFNRRIDEFETSLQHLFPAFAVWPEPAQLAALDVVFNVGIGNLQRDFPHLCAALLEQDWREAAEHSHRRESRDARNEAVRKLFEEAAG
jgi:GH24 family phage-related lysozyme (muramidase)